MPTDLLGVAVYVFALFPGVAFNFAREGHRPSGKRSAIRETATVVFVSTVCNAVVALVVAVAATLIRPVGDIVLGILGGNLTWVREHLLAAVVVGIVLVAAATLLGLLLGSKAIHEKGLKLIWKSEITRDTSAWSEVLRPKEALQVVVGLTLKDGTWASGLLHSFDPNPDPEPHRAIILTGTIHSRAPGADQVHELIGTDWVVIEAGDIEIMQVAHLRPELEPEPEPSESGSAQPSSKGPAS